MSRRKKPYLENVRIEALAAEGNGLAHVDGKVVFVQRAIPGDVVDVQINKVRSGYSAGYIVKMHQPSPYRRSPFCEHYGTCGGCTWQPLPYQMQIDFKRRQVEDQLLRIGHLKLPEVRPTLGSGKTRCYRNKLEYTFTNRRWVFDGEDIDALSDEERCGLGFHVGGFFDKAMDIKECHLQREPSNAIRLFAKRYALDNSLSFFDLRSHEGFMRNIVIRTTTTGELMVVMVFGNEAQDVERRGDITAFLDALLERFPEITSLYYVINPKCNDSWTDLPCHLYKGAEAIYEKMENLRFKIGPKSFYQTNSEQAYRLYSVVRDFVREGVDKRLKTDKPVIYDLYTGTGTIALFLSGLASKVIGIEYVPEAIEDAKVNATNNGISNSEFFAGDMKDILTSGFIAEHGKPDIVVLDPPRAGIHPDVAEVLLKAEPDYMVYVSCNPATQARDLAEFSRKYEITAVQPVDMFPHTTHVENVVALKKKSVVNLFTITSDLHDEMSQDVLSEPFIKEVEKKSDYFFRLKGADFTDYGKGDDMIYVRTGGTEGIFKSIFCKSDGKPVIPGNKCVRLLTSGQSNSLAASMEILSYLNSFGLEGRIIHGTPAELSEKPSIIRQLSASRKPLDGMRLGVIGRPSDWLISSDVDYDKVRTRLGAELVDIPISELIEKYGETECELPPSLASVNHPKYGKPISEEDFRKAVNFYGALKQIISEYKLNGLTIRCFDLLTSIGTTGCLALALLNSEGYVATCEGDIPAMLSMAVARVATGVSGFQVNLSRIQGERFLFAHCTVPLNMVDSYCYDTHFESGIGVAIHGEFVPGGATVFKIGAGLDSYIAEDVELESNQYLDNLCRTQVIVKAPGLAGYMLGSPLGNHHIIIPGHCAAKLGELLK
ncbi:MAG: 23S rRNA (uracil(1939)-C(5))-methyltransferase RlmD [Bacteroidales bacterium]|nr:23S rRNA (uracil(1939)-C(5))-methyltransferase RlmD [Bacteroidales bacterium]